MIAINKIFQGDRVIWIVFFLLCMISLIEVYSAASTLSYKSGDFYAPLLKQALFLGIGTFVCILIHKIPCRFFKVALFFLPFCWFLLLFTLLLGTSENDGSRWFELPGGFTFQPSEFAKGILVTTVALILGALQRDDGADERTVKYVMGFTGVTCALIVTENLSTAGILFSTIFLMLFIGRVATRQLLKLAGGLILLGCSVLLLAYSLPKDNPLHEKVFHRLATWETRVGANEKKPASDCTTTRKKKKLDIPPELQAEVDAYDMEGNAQRGHAYIAIASSNIVGRMPGNSVERDYLSQAYSDFIFAIILEELGIFGGGLVVFLYIVLLFRAGRIASRCERNFPAFLVMGLAILLVFQATINMLVATGLFPVTGQPLPLISRGGTSTLINCIYFGMILSVSRGARKNKPEDAGEMTVRLH